MATYRDTKLDPNIRYLGHAGFEVWTNHEIILMDPWLTWNGAYERSWFQYPCNHHLFTDLSKLFARMHDNFEYSQKHQGKNSTPCEDYQGIVYVSHEHQDHLDMDFLEAIEGPYTLLLPRFTRTYLQDKFADFRDDVTILLFDDKARFPLHDGYLEFYIEDSIREADSAVLLHMNNDYNFLNMNDCHIHDRINEIVERNGKIHTITGCFSGASWFPTCYDYDRETKTKKARTNKLARFKTMAHTLETLEPQFYIPSAGPPCFLEEGLRHHNYGDGIFPDHNEFLKFLLQRGKGKLPWRGFFTPLGIGQSVSWHMRQTEPVIDEDAKHEEIEQYHKEMMPILYHPKHKRGRVDMIKLQAMLQEKLDNFPLRNRLDMMLIVGDNHKGGVTVNFKAGSVGFSSTNSVESLRAMYPKAYIISSSPYGLAPLVEGRMTWYEWLLSLRFSIWRNPDEFNPILDGFLVNEAEDLPAFCEHYQQRQDTDRIVVQAAGKTYEVDRKCPHAGADLSNGRIEEDRYLVCPKHNWRFDLWKGGKCEGQNCSIDARKIDD